MQLQQCMHVAQALSPLTSYLPAPQLQQTAGRATHSIINHQRTAAFEEDLRSLQEESSGLSSVTSAVVVEGCPTAVYLAVTADDACCVVDVL